MTDTILPLTPALMSFQRIVVKIGSSLLVDHAQGALRRAWLEAFAQDIQYLVQHKKDVIIVSSGSVALGRTMLGMSSRTLSLEDKQAAAAVGQIALARGWAEVLGAHQLIPGQVLLTLFDTEERQRYLNARETMGRLLECHAIPVINENDTVATSEFRYGDNDRLAARVATMASADLLILLSDVDGLYTAPPHQDPNAQLIPVVPRITIEVENMAGEAASHLSRGGMRTKIEAAKIATTGGTHMVIANGQVMNPLQQIWEGGRCTWFLTPSTPLTARKKWLAGSLEPRGTLYVDAGARQALMTGASLLAAGIKRVEGIFTRGDCIIIRDHGGGEIGRGLVAYDAEEVVQIMGHKSQEIERILGYAGPAALVHRDDMALAGE